MWEHKSGTGRWKDFVNQETGEHSVKEHELKLVKKWCAVHRFGDQIPQNRELECLDCGQDVRFILGYHKLENGRIVINKPKKS